MSKKKVVRPFNEAATPYSFEILFNADLLNADLANLQTLTKALGMQIRYRGPSDDDGGYTVAGGILANSKYEMGKGATLHLTQPGVYEGAAAQFSLKGLAWDRKGLDVLDAIYDKCVKEIYAIGGKLHAPFEPNYASLERNSKKPKAP